LLDAAAPPSSVRHADTVLLAGREEWEIDGTVYGEVAELRRPGDLPVGCDQCFDGVGADYTIDSVTTNGFRGRWTSRSIGVMLDRRHARSARSGVAEAQRVLLRRAPRPLDC
jgi:hypothetical protein